MLYLILNYLRELLRPQHALLLENLALRQQILVLERQVKKPRFRDRHRALWVFLSQFWTNWKIPLRLVKPQTVCVHRTVSGSPARCAFPCVSQPHGHFQ
jgi:hypothetical protein